MSCLFFSLSQQMYWPLVNSKSTSVSSMQTQSVRTRWKNVRFRLWHRCWWYHSSCSCWTSRHSRWNIWQTFGRTHQTIEALSIALWCSKYGIFLAVFCLCAQGNAILSSTASPSLFGSSYSSIASSSTSNSGRPQVEEVAATSSTVNETEAGSNRQPYKHWVERLFRQNVAAETAARQHVTSIVAPTEDVSSTSTGRPLG